VQYRLQQVSRKLTQAMVAGLAVAMAGTALADGEVKSWRDSKVTRIEALALLETLNAELLSNDSATLTLDRWCEAHRMASPAKIVAERVHDVDKEATQEIRQLLNVGAADAVHYRRVRLHCGEHILSEADNWYVPARLTDEMNHVLDTTDTAFGRAVQALHFHRHTLSAELLWNPLPPGWDMRPALPSGAKGSLQVPPQTLQHRALLSLPDGTPFSLVVETYTNQILSFAQPPER
jgi:chorismate-pyruvate lyase